MPAEYRPLAEQIRPDHIDQVIGQQHLLGQSKPLYTAIVSGKLHSMVLWGPPGTGKTTLARLMAKPTDADFVQLSAVLSGVKDIRGAIDLARKNREQYQRSTILFIDEVHRFNKAQQDSFLPHVENGDIVFIGATTENPSFEVNNALLSRVRVYPLYRLQTDDLLQVIKRVQDHLSNKNEILKIDASSQSLLVEFADGDARRLLNLLDLALQIAEPVEDSGVATRLVDQQLIKQLVTGELRRFDKKGDLFYDQISALHKSVRGSAPDAALYWLARMLDGGCDSLYIARRVVRMASEDIGNADPRALQLALNAWDVVHRLGNPEGDLALAQVVIYLACAAKSNAVYIAFKRAMEEARSSGSLEVPIHLRNAPTKLMKEMGYGHAYQYAHDYDNAYVAGENYFPDQLQASKYYQPVSRGLEIKIAEKLEKLMELDNAKRQKPE